MGRNNSSLEEEEPIRTPRTNSLIAGKIGDASALQVDVVHLIGIEQSTRKKADRFAVRADRISTGDCATAARQLEGTAIDGAWVDGLVGLHNDDRIGWHVRCSRRLGAR